jgi:integrase
MAQDDGPWVGEIIAAFMDHAETYYTKGGEQTSEIACLKVAFRPLSDLYGHSPAKSFKPTDLKAVREAMIEHGHARKSINIHTSRIKNLFKWAASEGLVPGGVYRDLLTVAGLRRGRSKAKETKPVRPVSQAHIDAVLPHVLPPVAAMIQLQLLSGMRPGEVTAMRGQDIRLEGETWVYIPESHKTEHHDKVRRIFIGPKGQAILRPFMKEGMTGYLFSPARAMKVKNAKRRAQRRSPMTPTQSRRRRKRKPKRAPKERYTTDSYRRAIQRACARGEIPSWHPHQLRHAAASRFKQKYGIEAAKALLGHTSIDMTELYCEQDLARARSVMLAEG